MKILVTDGAGFVDANLVRMLLGSGYQVSVLDNLSAGRLEYLDGLDLEILKVDILDVQLENKILLGHDSSSIWRHRLAFQTNWKIHGDTARSTSSEL